jgi:hemerythrin superfamily protein
MSNDPNADRDDSGLPVDEPIAVLEADHILARDLFDRYLNTEDLKIKRDIAPRILVLLEVHTALEEKVFYPDVHGVDSSLVDQCKADHEQARQLIEQLHGMDLSDLQTDEVFRQLADLVLKYIDTEEQQLLPKVQQANLDLDAIGREMQTFEASVVAAQGYYPPQ